MPQKFIVIEIQTYADGSTGTLVDSYTEIYEAEQKYHTVLAAAAVSTVTIHAATILSETGDIIKSERYYHIKEPAEEA